MDTEVKNGEVNHDRTIQNLNNTTNEDEESLQFDNSMNKFDNTINTTLSSDISNCTINSELNITVIHVPSSTKSNDNRDSIESNIKDIEEDIVNRVNDNERNNKDYTNEGKDSKDGSDSGVEGCAVDTHRVQSRNSVEYASSCTGLDEASCDSSLASCCSVYEDAPCSTTILSNCELDNDAQRNIVESIGPTSLPQNGNNGEGTSEGGSESSSVTGSVSSRQKRPNAIGTTVKKKLNTLVSESQKSSTQRINSKMTSSTSCLVNGTCPNGARAKPRTSSIQRANSLTRSQVLTKDRGRSREKVTIRDNKTRDGSTVGINKNTSVTRSNSAVSRSKTRSDTVTSALTNEINKDLAQRGRASVGKSKPRQANSVTRASQCPANSSNTAKSGCLTPSEESSRSLSTVGRSTSLYNSAVRPELRSTRQLDKMTSSFDGSGRILETYGTLPRTARNKFIVPKAPGDKPLVSNRSRSGSRDASLNRLLNKRAIGKDCGLPNKGLPPCPKQKVTPERIRIYHEVSIQTGLTGQDIVNCLAGVATIVPNPESAERAEQGTQTEGSWEDLKLLKENLKKATDESEAKQKENSKLKSEVDILRKQLEEEKTEHAFVRQELDKNTQRVLAMLGTPQSEHTDGSDSFLELESHIQSSGKVVVDQKVEIASLQGLCKLLSRDLEKSLAAQKGLIQQQQELETESLEMQEFLQEEKATLEIALKEAEAENQKKEESIKQLSSELERQTEECKHLVRISEQRRQENLSLSMKLNALERRSRELLLAQGAAVSGASVALSGLGSRLEGLVDQLIMSYNISEKDLEDVIYHNEAFSRSNSSIDSSPVSSKHSTKDCTPSPKRGSFVSAVIGAIRNAATHPFATKQTNDKKIIESAKPMRKDANSESSSDILDFETEPCLMMESVLEDVPLADTYSHNMVSSCDSFRRILNVPEPLDDHNLRKTKLRGESSSLTNLTQAILNRRKVEDEEEENGETTNETENGPTDGSLPLTDYCPVTSLVDQVIDVDNLVTKLLKVLRIIQLDNDTCIQELKDEKTELELRLEILLAERKVAEYSHDSEKENYSNGLSERTNILENCKHVIKEINNAKELINESQGEKKNCTISDESKDENTKNDNAPIRFSSSVCS